MKSIILLCIIGMSLAVPIENYEEWARKSSWYRSPRPGDFKKPLGLQASEPQLNAQELDHNTEDHKRSYYEPAALPAQPIVPHPAPSYSGPTPVPAAHALAIPQVAAPSAVGLFPNARVGGCNVPILLSCSPSVIPGHLAHANGYAPAYREIEDFMRDADFVNTRTANHHKISEDYPAPLQGSHHTVSKDYPEPNLTRIVKTPPSEQAQSLEGKHFEQH